MDLNNLAAEFPREAVSWRAQSLTRTGDKAMALAYIDARDVMDRLDEVCGPENWQSEFTETPKGRVICRLGIKVGDHWVWKSDGAGNTDVEGEKGAISDALKRAAVHWGIGRYLYDMPDVWCPCESYEDNGKKKWRRWTDDPWNHVRRRAQQAAQQPKPQPTPEPTNNVLDEQIAFREAVDAALQNIAACATIQDLKVYMEALYKDNFAVWKDGRVEKAKNARKAELARAA